MAVSLSDGRVLVMALLVMALSGSDGLVLVMALSGSDGLVG